MNKNIIIGVVFFVAIIAVYFLIKKRKDKNEVKETVYKKTALKKDVGGDIEKKNTEDIYNALKIIPTIDDTKSDLLWINFYQTMNKG